MAAITSAALVAGAGVYSANKASKTAKEMQAASVRDLGQETSDIIGANQQALPGQYALEQEYGPKFAALNRQIQWDNLFNENNGTLKMGLDAVNQVSEANQLSNTAQRSADIADATNLGGDVLALQKSMNPELYDMLTRVDSRAAAGSGASPALSALSSSLGLPASSGWQAPRQGGGQGPTPPGFETSWKSPQGGAPLAQGGVGPIQPAAPAGDRNRVGELGVREATAPGAVSAAAAALVDGPNVDLAAARAKQVGDVGNRGASPILSQIQESALADLRLGGAIDPRARNQIEQSVLSQYNRNGRAMDNRASAAIAGELAKSAEAIKDQRFGRALNAEGAIQDLQRTNVGIDQGNQAAAGANAQLDLQAQLANAGNRLSLGQMDLQSQLANQASRNEASGRGLEAQLANQRAALSMNELGQAGDIARGQLALGRSGANQSADQQYQQGLANLAQLQNQTNAIDFSNLQQALGNRLATQFDPFAGVLGRSSLNNSSLAQQRAQSNFDTAPNAGLNLMQQYASGLFGQNSANAAAGARQQHDIAADFLAGSLGGLGQFGGAYIGSNGG